MSNVLCWMWHWCNCSIEWTKPAHNWSKQTSKNGWADCEYEVSQRGNLSLNAIIYVIKWYCVVFDIYFTRNYWMPFWFRIRNSCVLIYSDTFEVFFSIFKVFQKFQRLMLISIQISCIVNFSFYVRYVMT